jgi:hypothetical protein
MKDWNRTGKVKAIILGLLFLPNIIIPNEPFMVDLKLHMILGSLIFGLVAIPIISKMNASIFGQVISKPTWNESPLTLKKPLTFFHFGAFFMLVAGLSTIIGTLIKYNELNLMGFQALFFGTGILGGIYVTLKLNKIE